MADSDTPIPSESLRSPGEAPGDTVGGQIQSYQKDVQGGAQAVLRGYLPRNREYYENQEYVLDDLTEFARVGGEDIRSLTVSNMRGRHIAIRSGERMSGGTYLRQVAKMFGLRARNGKDWWLKGALDRLKWIANGCNGEDPAKLAMSVESPHDQPQKTKYQELEQEIPGSCEPEPESQESQLSPEEPGKEKPEPQEPEPESQEPEPQPMEPGEGDEEGRVDRRAVLGEQQLQGETQKQRESGGKEQQGQQQAPPSRPQPPRPPQQPRSPGRTTSPWLPPERNINAKEYLDQLLCDHPGTTYYGRLMRNLLTRRGWRSQEAPAQTPPQPPPATRERQQQPQ